MIEITKKEFNDHPIYRQTSNAFVTKAYYKHEKLLGVILFDHDGEWACVVLAPHTDGFFRGIDMRVSLSTCASAIAALAVLFKEHEHVVLEDGGPPMTKEQGVKIIAAVSGMPEDRVRAGLEDFERKPKPGNN